MSQRPGFPVKLSTSGVALPKSSRAASPAPKTGQVPAKVAPPSGVGLDSGAVRARMVRKLAEQGVRDAAVLDAAFVEAGDRLQKRDARDRKRDVVDAALIPRGRRRIGHRRAQSRTFERHRLRLRARLTRASRQLAQRVAAWTATGRLGGEVHVAVELIAPTVAVALGVALKSPPGVAQVTALRCEGGSTATNVLPNV